ncbi:MAG TPA: helix-turn-helix transcriptional regulator [Rubricoccaceae bacterium]|jgi:DNA-binding transcriptional regulator YiaG
MDWTPEAITRLRADLRLSQTDLAPLLGYTRPQSVGDLESGKRKPSGAVCILLSQLADGLATSATQPEGPGGSA